MSKELDARLAALIERCDETDRLIVDTRRFADLESENAKLRDDRERMFRACVEKNKTILRLCDERARLREMCRRLFDELYTLVDDNFSDVYSQYEHSDVQPFYDELRELGIEVDV